MAPTEDAGSIECREEEGLLPVNRHVQDKRCLVSQSSWKFAQSDVFVVGVQLQMSPSNQSDGAWSLNSALSRLHFDAHMTELPRYRTATAAASEVEDIWWSSTWHSPERFTVLSTVLRHRWPDLTNWMLSAPTEDSGTLPKKLEPFGPEKRTKKHWTQTHRGAVRI